MPAYFIFVRDEVKNPDQYAAYSRKAASSGAGHSMKPIIANGAVTALEGAAPDGVIVVEFPTVDAAKAWYNSPAYQAAIGDRLASTTGRAFIVEGFSPG